MNKQISLFLSFFILLTTLSYAQNGHTPLKCVGDIPEDFLKLSYQKYEDDKSTISKKDSRRTKKDKNTFYLSSNYQLDKLLQTGSVLFGDELTNYVNKIAGNLLDKSGKSELKKELRFYVVKSSQINAFATQQGMIFVTVGLLSQIENEAQLAFVLAHEISHYEKKHNISSYLESKKQERAYKRSRKSFENLVKNLSSFSKEQELEADRDGFTMFEKAGYDVEEANSMMIVLQYSHLPFDEVKFDKTFFNAGHYIIPPTKFNDTLNLEIADNSDEDDSKSSHPNIKKRITELSELITDETTKTGGGKFLYAKEEFSKMQKTARLENLNLNLLSGDYIRVVYEGFLLRKKYPKNKYISQSMAKGLYALSKVKTYSSERENEDYSESVSEYEGESKVLHDLLLAQMNPLEINILALKYMEGLKDSTLAKYKEDLIFDLVKKHELTLNDFTDKYVAPVVKKEKVVEKDTVDFSKLSKIEKIKYKRKQTQKKNEVEGGKEYYKLAFIDEKKDKEFVALFEEASKKEIVLTDDEIMEEMTWKERQKYIKKRNKEMKKPKHLGIDKIIIVDPAYTLRNSSKEKKLVKSEEKEIKHNEILTNAAQKIGLETVLLCKEEYDNNSTDLFNDEATIKEWIGEYSYYTDFKMLPMTGDRMALISKKYNSDYVLLSGIDASKYRREKRGRSILLAFVIYPAAPYYFYKAFSFEHRNTYFNFLIDTKTGKLVMKDLRETTQKEKEFNSRSIIYDVMYQINSEK